MNKTLFRRRGRHTLAILLLLLPALPPRVEAQLNYVTNNGVIIITGFTGPATTLIIPDTINGFPVGLIASQALRSCTNLTHITIPSSVTNIGTQAFTQCDSLQAFTVDASNPIFRSVDGVLFDKNQTVLIQYPGGKPGTYEIPNGLINLGVGPFAFSTGLTGVIIPKTVTALGSFTFYTCPNLSAVHFRGDAPAYGTGALDFDPEPIVYYLPGTMGWGPTYAWHPTALWKPLLRVGDSKFGAQTNQFGFTIDWASDDQDAEYYYVSAWDVELAKLQDDSCRSVYWHTDSVHSARPRYWRSV